MPYISQEERNAYADALDLLVRDLAVCSEEQLGGHLNYCVNYLLIHLFKQNKRYVRINTLRGAVENALSEFYRCQVAEYEDEKRNENGKV